MNHEVNFSTYKLALLQLINIMIIDALHALLAKV